MQAAFLFIGISIISFNVNELYAADKCYEAKICIHNGIERCGRNFKGIFRRFLDSCDMKEYNCLKNTDFYKVPVIRCRHLPPLDLKNIKNVGDSKEIENMDIADLEEKGNKNASPLKISSEINKTNDTEPVINAGSEEAKVIDDPNNVDENNEEISKENGNLEQENTDDKPNTESNIDVDELDDKEENNNELEFDDTGKGDDIQKPHQSNEQEKANIKDDDGNKQKDDVDLEAIDDENDDVGEDDEQEEKFEEKENNEENGDENFDHLVTMYKSKFNDNVKDDKAEPEEVNNEGGNEAESNVSENREDSSMPNKDLDSKNTPDDKNHKGCQCNSHKKLNLNKQSAYDLSNKEDDDTIRLKISPSDGDGEISNLHDSENDKNEEENDSDSEE